MAGIILTRMNHSTTKATKSEQARLDAIHAMRWEIIPGYDGLYRVSDSGVVQSCHKCGTKIGERCEWWTRKLYTKPNGYLSVGFGPHGNRCNYYVHRLVADAFIPNPDQLPAINHLDGDKTNNLWTNLEWCTNAQNTLHAVENGLIVRGSKHPFCILSDDQVRQIRAMTGKTYKEIGKIFGVCAQTVCDVKRRSGYADVL